MFHVYALGFCENIFLYYQQILLRRIHAHFFKISALFLESLDQIQLVYDWLESTHEFQQPLRQHLRQYRQAHQEVRMEKRIFDVDQTIDQNYFSLTAPKLYFYGNISSLLSILIAKQS